MTDKTTKLLLALIALGLWVNVTMPLFHPAAASAQDMSTVEQILKSIESDVGRIGRGTCVNDKIC